MFFFHVFVRKYCVTRNVKQTRNSNSSNDELHIYIEMCLLCDFESDFIFFSNSCIGVAVVLLFIITLKYVSFILYI